MSGRGKYTDIDLIISSTTGSGWQLGRSAVYSREEARGRGATRDEVRAVTVFPAAS